MLEQQVTDQRVGEILALLDDCLGVGRHAADGDAQHVGDAAELADGVRQQADAVAALVGVGRQLALDVVGRRLSPTGLGDHDLGLGEAQQRVQLVQQVVRGRHERPCTPGRYPEPARTAVSGHTTVTGERAVPGFPSTSGTRRARRGSMHGGNRHRCQHGVPIVAGQGKTSLDDSPDREQPPGPSPPPTRSHLDTRVLARGEDPSIGRLRSRHLCRRRRGGTSWPDQAITRLVSARWRCPNRSIESSSAGHRLPRRGHAFPFDRCSRPW